MSLELKDGVWKILPPSQSGKQRHPFWDFYSAHSEDHPTSPESLKQMEIEFDFFGYIDAPPTTSPPQRVPNWTCPRVDRKKEDSPDTELRKAVIFEVTQSQHVVYKLAQLELRLAVFLAKRRLKLKKLKVEGHLSIVDVVACAGLCIPEAYVIEVLAFVRDDIGMAKHLPLTFQLNRANAFCVIPEAEDRLGVPNVVQTPKFVWVQLLPDTDDATKPSTAVAFEVSPTRNNIDSLKDAVKAKIPEKLVGIASIDLKVYACIAEGVWAEVDEDAPLRENVKTSAYHVVVPKL
jgi:hypothetical protein